MQFWQGTISIFFFCCKCYAQSYSRTHICNSSICWVPAYANHPNYLSLSAWMCFVSTLQSGVVTLFLEPNLNAWKINSRLQLDCTLYAGIMGSAVAFCLQAWCIKKRGPLFSGMFSPLVTLIVTVLAALFLHEELYTGSLIGAIGVIIGLYIVLWVKAGDVFAVKEKIDPKLMVNETQEVIFSINESYGETSSSIDLEEPLLTDVVKTRSYIIPMSPQVLCINNADRKKVHVRFSSVSGNYDS